MIIASGVMPGPSGVGRLVEQLRAERDERGLDDIRFLFGATGTHLGKAVRGRDYTGILRRSANLALGYGRLGAALVDPAFSDPSNPLVLIHQQTLGRFWVKSILARRKAPVVLYMMDNAFFCIRSYNHITNEDRPCLKCLGQHYEQARLNGCRVYPRSSLGIRGQIQDLAAWAKRGKVRFLAQTEGQRWMLQQQFGNDVLIEVIGLWTKDFPRVEAITPTGKIGTCEYDVVFHGNPSSAKGFYWAIELASKIPDIKFIFPTFQPNELPSRKPLPLNVSFRPMNWESGLNDLVRDAALVLNPSLWSAPIEGALVKSIIHGRRVAVVKTNTSWSAELPENLMLHLSNDPAVAAVQVKDYLNNPQPLDHNAKQAWYENFNGNNSSFLLRLVKAVERISSY